MKIISLPEFQTTSLNSTLELGPQMFLVVRIYRLTIVEVVNPKIDAQWNCVQPSIKYLNEKQFKKPSINPFPLKILLRMPPKINHQVIDKIKNKNK